MAGFWDSFSTGFDRGVPLGVRTAERTAETKRRQAERVEDQGIALGRELRAADERQGRYDVEAQRYNTEEQRRKTQDVRLGEQHTSAMTDAGNRQKEAEFQQAQRKRALMQERMSDGIAMVKGLSNAGKDAKAVRAAVKLYRELYPDGKDVHILAKEDNPEHEVWKKYPDAEFVGMSKDHRYPPTPLTGKEIVAMIESLADPKNYNAGLDQAEKEVSTANLGAKPYWAHDQDGNPIQVVDEQYIDKNTKKKRTVPYTGPAPMNKEEEKVRAIMNIPDEFLSKEGKEIKLGVRSPAKDQTTPTTAVALRARAAEIKKENPELAAEFLKAARESEKAAEKSAKTREFAPSDTEKKFNFWKSLYPDLSDVEIEKKVRKEDIPSESRYVLDFVKEAIKNDEDPIKAETQARDLYRRLTGAGKAEPDSETKKGAGVTAREAEVAQRRGFVQGPDGKWKKSGDDRRADGTLKGKGFLGELNTTDGSGKVATEMAIGVEFDGKEVQIPTLVPTLSKSEKEHLLAGRKPTRAIIDKAVAHAKKRKAEGKGPFVEDLPTPSSAGMPALGEKKPGSKPPSVVSDDRVPGYSPRQWGGMSENEKKTAREKYKAERKAKYYSGSEK